MRKLNKKQKGLIDEWLKENKNNLTYFVEASVLPYELYERIETLNDFETIYQEVTNYIFDSIED